MGMKKPLNRAAFVFFAIAAIAKVQIVLGLAAQVAGRYDLLYAAFLLVAVLLWSVALGLRRRLAALARLHRRAVRRDDFSRGVVARADRELAVFRPTSKEHSICDTISEGWGSDNLRSEQSLAENRKSG